MCIRDRCRYTHDTIGTRKPIDPRVVIILKDTIDTIEESEATTELAQSINRSGSTAYLIELKPTWEDLPHTHLAAHNVTPSDVEHLRKFIEAKKPDLLYWDGASSHLSDSTTYWLKNNYWTHISSEEILGENLAEKLLEVAIPDVPKCRFYHRAGPELHCDTVEGNWHAEFWRAGEKYWQHTLATGLWARYAQQWYQEWECRIYNTDTGHLQYTLKPDLTHFGVHLESSSLGDTLSFMGQIEQMNSERDHERLVVRTHKQFLFDWKLLATRNIVKSEWSDAIYPQNYQGLGVFQTEAAVSDPEKHPRDWRTIPMGSIAADQLGISYVERRPTMAPEFYEKHPSADARGVCIATASTAQAKYWNHPTGWQALVNKFRDKTMPVYYISSEDTKLEGVEHISDLVDVAQYMRATNKLVGISSGLSWLAWALDINVAMISGFTWEFVEFNCEVRIINRDVCSGCWTWARFDRGDWNWCPQNKGNERQFECTKTITPEEVWQQLETSGKFGI